MIESVAVGSISPGYVSTGFHDALVTLILSRGGIGGRVSVRSGPRVATGRNQVVRAFLDNTECEWLWMVDSDMTFEPTVLDRLLTTATTHDLQIVGGLCFGLDSTGEVFPVLFRDEEGRPARVTNYKENSLVEVTATGAACLLIHREVLEKMEANFELPYIWFEESTWDDKEVGEDTAFCYKARELGYRIVVDTSITLGHIKDQIVTEASFKEWRRKEKRERRKGKR